MRQINLMSIQGQIKDKRLRNGGIGSACYDSCIDHL